VSVRVDEAGAQRHIAKIDLTCLDRYDRRLV
jgi:hypothetical protein